MKRHQARRHNGRFTRATLENTFGLSAPACPHCGRLNPHPAGSQAPEECHACGRPMVAIYRVWMADGTAGLYHAASEAQARAEAVAHGRARLACCRLACRVADRLRLTTVDRVERLD